MRNSCKNVVSSSNPDGYAPFKLLMNLVMEILLNINRIKCASGRIADNESRALLIAVAADIVLVSH